MIPNIQDILPNLTLEQRQVLYVIFSRSDQSGWMTHPHGKSVTFIIGNDIDRHPGTVYRYLSQLKRLGLISIQKHPSSMRKGRANGSAVRLHNKQQIDAAHIIMELITPPNAKFMQGRIERIKAAGNTPTA